MEQTGKSASDMRLIITASALGTVFEWYDFFVYGTLSAIIGKSFFPVGNATLQTLLVWAGFAVGFVFRPLGAVLFGFLGDRLGRKYTFLVTVVMMGVATTGVGLTPSAASIGLAAPLIVLALRALQGLALGGEFGGAAVYVAEHAPTRMRGFYTSFIQAGVGAGFTLSLIVVLAAKTTAAGISGPSGWEEWGWRLPFLFSLVLLALSLWIRLKLSESPVFQKMRAAGELAGNPFVESFTYPGNLKRLFVALFGIAAGMTVIWYATMLYSLSFLKAMRLEETMAQLAIGVAAVLGTVFYPLAGWFSDRVGRKPPIVIGYVLALALLFPLFWGIGATANPGLASAAARAPVVVAGPDCGYSPFSGEQPTDCGKLLADLAALGVDYRLEKAPALMLGVGGQALPIETYAFADKARRGQQLQAWLGARGYDLIPVRPGWPAMLAIVLMFMALMGMVALVYAPMSALLAEMFPPRIRYSSLSIPYHLGTGYFGGFLPLIASYIVAKTGDGYAWVWYPWVVVAAALAISLWGVKGGLPALEGDDGH